MSISMSSFDSSSPKEVGLKRSPRGIVKRVKGFLNRRSRKNLEYATPIEALSGKSFEVDVALQG
jgi:hypothetical protein